jgi:hypothetical protein
MPVGRTEIEQERFKLLKTARAFVNLKHSLAAADELNHILPELQRQFDVSVQNGELPDASAERVLRELVLDA